MPALFSLRAGYPLSGVSDWDFRLAKLTGFAVMAGAESAAVFRFWVEA